MKIKLNLLVVLVLLFAMTSISNASVDKVKVGILDDVEEVLIGAENGIKVMLDNGVELSLILADRFNVKKNNDLISFGKNIFQEDKILIYPVDSNSLISVNGRKYRGYLEILNNNKGLTVVNHVDFDYYLASVVGSEISARWPMDSLKAQAVVARTYALRNIKSHASKGYNLSATVRSQAYKGYAFEHPRTLTAVKETHNEVAIYQGQLIAAVYHSTAGGQTAKGATIWSSDTPYLQSVSSPDDISPHYSWQKEYSKDEIEKILVAKGVPLTGLKQISLEGVGPSGRASFIRIFDINDRIYDVDSSTFRFWLGLKSTRFTINNSSSLKLSNLDNSFTFDLESLGVKDDFTTTDEDDHYQFVGYGWGHGVGMSQWGAYQMAKEGYTYQEILKHYYQGIDIGEW
ncbi:hypothetical protein U472_12445 [Orenia metallireducens]|jgi:stage II sporulation protein D|uniref:Sporulation stage II protein D amidase enhancer LytB N-terminal domain-containing protein n=1 Tax=Orenia metallireducens TaxID=1413210 RepID=A0A1C0A4W2_9FIRM|nr:SpoIID/LytB domain-containing protein [Orenia metallireducens]OCL25174.1 hypothetical protein U472_12445 [Orenia metallireducens]